MSDRPSPAGVLSGHKLRQLREAGYEVVDAEAAVCAEYDCPNCGAHVVTPGKVLGGDDVEAGEAALEVLADVRRVVFEHVGRESEFYHRWLAATVTRMDQMPALVRAALEREAGS